MPTIVGDQIWFRFESMENPNPNPWHAFIEGQPEALCEQARIVYYQCETRQTLPPEAIVHDACAEAVKKRNAA